MGPGSGLCVLDIGIPQLGAEDLRRHSELGFGQCVVDAPALIRGQRIGPDELDMPVAGPRAVGAVGIEGEKDHPGYYQWRMEASQSGATAGYFLTVIAMQERFDMTPTCRVSETDETVDVEIMQPGRRIEIHLNKVLSDRFGRMIVESAGAHGWLETELLEAVQPITVDADGVRWGEFEFH